MSPRFAVMFKTHFWAWSGYNDCVYGPDEIRLALSCFNIYSQRAISMLCQRRLAMADEFRTGKLSFWPNNEAFIPTEIRRANYKSALLQSFGRSISMIGGRRCTKVNLKIIPTKPSFIRCLKETDMSGVFCGTKGASFPFLTLIARSGAGLPIKVPKVFVGNFAGNWARGVCVTFSESWKMPG
jgi:hypothetical protein